MASKTIMSHAVFARTSAILQSFNKCIATRSSPKCQLASFYATSATAPVREEIIRINEKTGLIEARKESIGMQRYRQLVHDYAEMIKKEGILYEKGRRHLANIMGEDVENFSPKDVKEAIEYLLPSALYAKEARPIMKPPQEVFGAVKEAKFDESGRPASFLFYTVDSDLYEVLHKGAGELQRLDAEYERHLTNNIPFPEENMEGYTLALTDTFLSSKGGPKLSEEKFKLLSTLVKRLVNHPMSALASEFLSQFRKRTQTKVAENVCQVEELEDGRKKITFPYCRRKTARGTLTLTYPGNGNITVNGKDITYFDTITAREQVLYPLVLSRLLGKVDFEATVTGSGHMAQAGAIRLGLSNTLAEIVDEDTRTIMRTAGLLNTDPRRRERKKPGQAGARRKYTWLKR